MYWTDSQGASPVVRTYATTFRPQPLMAHLGPKNNIFGPSNTLLSPPYLCFIIHNVDCESAVATQSHTVLRPRLERKA